MRLDHVSYVASHDQISDVVNRIGSQIGTAFIDGGIHPKFGTRNFTAPLLNGQYIEVVCPMDHPATDLTPFGKVVKNKANEGGGWLAWVFNVEDISKLENKLSRKAVQGTRMKPDGTELRWKQIGVSDISENPCKPFFIEWDTNAHPAKDGIATAKIIEINFFESKLDLSRIVPSENNLSDIKYSLSNSNTESGINQIIFLVGNNEIAIL